MTALVCSTDHLTRAERKTLDQGRRVNATLTDAMRWEYGYCLFIGSSDENRTKGLSEGFAGAIRCAHALGLHWLRLDQDADPLPGVPTYQH